jgi:hypothetical protein
MISPRTRTCRRIHGAQPIITETVGGWDDCWGEAIYRAWAAARQRQAGGREAGPSLAPQLDRSLVIHELKPPLLEGVGCPRPLLLQCPCADDAHWPRPLRLNIS